MWSLTLDSISMIFGLPMLSLANGSARSGGIAVANFDVCLIMSSICSCEKEIVVRMSSALTMMGVRSRAPNVASTFVFSAAVVSGCAQTRRRSIKLSMRNALLALVGLFVDLDAAVEWARAMRP